MPRPRAKTDLYLRAVECAVRAPGRWIEIDRGFGSKYNAAMTAHYLRRGYLRVKPRASDTAVVVRGTRYLATAAEVEPRVVEQDGEWKVSIRYERWRRRATVVLGVVGPVPAASPARQRTVHDAEAASRAVRQSDSIVRDGTIRG